MASAPNEPQNIGRYRLLCYLATGGMAEVWIAEGPNSRSDPLVCVKLMLAGLERDQDFLTMFIEEAKLTAPLSHPNLVQIDDLGVSEGRLYLAMEYIRGHAVSVLTHALSLRREMLAPELAASMLAQACRGLDFAHNSCGADGKPLGLVHRDVSPHNLILRDDGRLKVVDFGIAKATSISGTRTANLKGKIGYMAPEQIHGKGIDRRTDIFALGVTLWQLLTGKRLFAGASDAEILSRVLTTPVPDPREVVPDLPEEIAQITLRACAHKPASRYPTALQMAEELEALASRRLDQPPEQALADLVGLVLPPMPRTVDEALERARTARKLPTGSLLNPAGESGPSGPSGPPATRARAATPPGEIAGTAAVPVGRVAPPAPSPPARGRDPSRLAAVIGAAAGLLAVSVFAAWYLRAPVVKKEAPPPPRLAAVAPDASPPPAPQAPGFLSLRTNPWSNVFLGDASLGHTPLLKVSLPAGKHTLRLQNDRAGSFLYAVEIRAGESADPGIVSLEGLERAP